MRATFFPGIHLCLRCFLNDCSMLSGIGMITEIEIIEGIVAVEAEEDMSVTGTMTERDTTIVVKVTVSALTMTEIMVEAG